MIEIDQAVLTRWNAKSLSSVITGGVWFGDVPELTPFPYCIYTVVSDNVNYISRGSQRNIKTIQFQTYALDVISLGAAIQAIDNAFMHADRALTNPLYISPSIGYIANVADEGNSIILKESDTVWSGTISYAIDYIESSRLTPA